MDEENYVLESPTNIYTITKVLGGTDSFNLYLCQVGTGQQFILKIATSVAENGVLDREAVLLGDMREEATRLEEEYARVTQDPNKALNYQLCFWELVESFISSTQGNRRVNILGYPAVDDLSTLVPVGHITSRDCVRVDPKTSAWMLGKLLKLLVFLHSQNISLGPHVTGENILIERHEHYVIVFDLTGAVFHSEGIPQEIAREEISQAAREVIYVLGGDPDMGVLPKDEQDADGRYANYVLGLARGGECDAKEAHAKFYELVRSLWPREYWPFTSHPLN